MTDIVIDENNVTQLVKGGRTRWKVENEGFNTLKNQGYHIEHNFGYHITWPVRTIPQG